MSTALVVSVIDELVAELEEACREPGQGFMIETGEVLTLLAERAELLRDAERYRWLREQEAEHGVSVVNISQWLSAATCVAVTFVDGSFVDYAIDKAMQSEAKP